MLTVLSCISAILWLGLLFAPWRPWSTTEKLENFHQRTKPLSHITALIPARDEAECIAETIMALASQGCLGGIIVVDDQSTDETAIEVKNLNIKNLELIEGQNPPLGWTGKLWALEQGRKKVSTPYLLLLDADIRLAPQALANLSELQQKDNLDLVSVMALLHVGNLREKFLLPAFTFFFKLIYPFALSNNPNSKIAGAAGGCILIRTSKLDSIGGFGALHDAIIDDCTLAKLVKESDGRTWIGLSDDVEAIRPYGTLTNIWDMVARTAFTQLKYSLPLLLLCSALLAISFLTPLAGLLSGNSSVRFLSTISLIIMCVTYLPTVRHYKRSPLWVCSLPFASSLFLAMTWTSAIRYWRGERTRWKNRVYTKLE
jgi:hopene-associated glycosyltransferase HpnB